MKRLVKLQIHTLFFLALLLVSSSAALYLPWQNNPLVFDDLNLFSSPTLFSFAETPFSLTPRWFPYFTLGFERVISNGNLLVSRYVTCVLHGVNGFLLFLLCYRFLSTKLLQRRAFLIALSIALIFVLHPVAVYGVGYLVQRTIIFATLFLLLSALQFDRALLERSWRLALVAGVCFGFSVMSKEHALFGVLSVLGIVLLRRPFDWPRLSPVILAFLASALPFGFWVVFCKVGLIGAAYEPDAGDIVDVMGLPDGGNWPLSIALQCLFFFRYLCFWWWPDPSGMSIDIRPDYDALIHTPTILFGPLCFVALSCTIAFLMFSRRTSAPLRLVAFGLFWAVSLFLVELVSIRFQEPVVLYRSYLWAPGFLLAVAGGGSLIPFRIALPVLAIAILAVIPLSWGRLATFSDELKLWQEASQKLPRETTAGAIRIRYNLGFFRARSGLTQPALNDFEWVIQQSPKAFHGYWGRSTVHLYRRDLRSAAEDLEMVIKLKPDFGAAYLRLALIQKSLGQNEASEKNKAKGLAFGQPNIAYE